MYDVLVFVLGRSWTPLSGGNSCRVPHKIEDVQEATVVCVSLILQPGLQFLCALFLTHSAGGSFFVKGNARSVVIQQCAVTVILASTATVALVAVMSCCFVLRWHACPGQLGQSLDDVRVLPLGCEEFNTDGMSDFAARYRRVRHCSLARLRSRQGCVEAGRGICRIPIITSLSQCRLALHCPSLR